jgi:putative transcriptional regulator
VSWAGKLLVATPALTDANFARTVVQLVTHSDDDGALGVVVNRPSDTPLGDVLPGWALLAPDPDVVFIGGPVQESAAICLARLGPGEPDDSVVVVPGAPWLGTLDLEAEMADVVQEVRVFAGYSGWSPGQLEAEVEEEAWWVLDGLPSDCFTPDPHGLWSAVLRRQGPPMALAATYPPDVALN